MDKFLLVNGPNLNLLGEREPEIYGNKSLAEINELVKNFALKSQVELKCFQSNSEGQIIDFLHENRNWAEGIVMNPAALTHYSYALLDCVMAIDLPLVEVHLSDTTKRESFRQHSVLEDVREKAYIGMGFEGYLRGMEFLIEMNTIKLVSARVNESADNDTLLTACVEILKKRHPKYDWVGIYLVDGDELVLHNYIGRPSPHTRIPIGKGICGAAVIQKESIIVPDVNSDPRYLACSIETKSEIVVPIYKNNEIIGEIDIDSDTKNVFHDDDQSMLEAIADIIEKKNRLISAKISHNAPNLILEVVEQPSYLFLKLF